MRSYSNQCAQGASNPLSIQNGISQLKRDDIAQSSAHNAGTRQEQVAAVIEPVTNMPRASNPSNQSTELKAKVEREINLNQFPVKYSFDQSESNALNQSNFENQSVMKMPEVAHAARHGNSGLAQTYSKQAGQNFNLSHFMERKASLRSPKSAGKMAGKEPGQQQKQDHQRPHGNSRDRNPAQRQTSANNGPKK